MPASYPERVRTSVASARVTLVPQTRPHLEMMAHPFASDPSLIPLLVPGHLAGCARHHLNVSYSNPILGQLERLGMRQRTMLVTRTLPPQTNPRLHRINTACPLCLNHKATKAGAPRSYTILPTPRTPPTWLPRTSHDISSHCSFVLSLLLAMLPMSSKGLAKINVLWTPASHYSLGVSLACLLLHR